MSLLPVSNLRFRERLLPIAASQGIGLACGLANVHFTTRWVSPADYGRYGIFLSLAPLGMWVFHAGLIKWVARHWGTVVAPGAAFRPLMENAFKTLPLFGAVAIGLGVLVDEQAWWITGPLLAVIALLLSVATAAQTGLQASRRHWADFGVSAVSSVSRSFTPLLIYLAFPGLLSLAVGYSVHTLVYAGIALALNLSLRKGDARDNPHFNPVYGGRLFFALAVAHGVLSAVNRWIAGIYFSADYAGLFTLAGNIALVPTTMLGLILSQQFQPDLFAMPTATLDQRRALASRVDRLAFGYTLLSVAGLVALPWALPRFLTGFVRPAYVDAIPLVTAAGAFTVAIFLGQFFQAMLLAAHREKGCARVDLPCAVILVGGGVAAASLGGTRAFQAWLTCSPAVPWLYNRTVARRVLFNDDDVQR